MDQAGRVFEPEAQEPKPLAEVSQPPAQAGPAPTNPWASR
jgi:hypothetical protein